MSEKQSVLSELLLNILSRVFQRLFVVGSAESKLRLVDNHRAVRWIVYIAVRAHVAYETARAGNEEQRDAIGVRSGVNLNVIVQTAREKPVYGSCYLLRIEGLTLLHELHTFQVPRVERLRRRIVLDSSDDFSLKIVSPHNPCQRR